MAEKKVIELEIRDNVGGLKQQYKEAVKEVQRLVDKYGEASAEVAQAAKNAAYLKDKIEDANDAIQAFKGEGTFIATNKAIGAAASGLSAYEGAMGLIGVKSEALQETILKVQSAMALSQGLEGLEDAGRAFTTLGLKVSGFGQKAMSAFSSMTNASKLFLVSGIGLLIAALGTVVYYWEDISSAIGLTTKAQEEYLKKQKAIAEEQKKQNEFVAKESAGFATLIARLEVSNKGSKERKDLIKEINSQYGTTLKNLDDEASFQKQLNGELKNYLEYQRQKYTLQANEEKIQRNLKTQAELNKKLADEQKELEKIEGIIERRRAKGDTTDVQEHLFEQRIKRQTRVINDVKEELSNAEKRFESYGRAATKASASIDDLTDSGKKYNETAKETISVNKDTEKYIITEGMKQREMDAENLKNYLADINASKSTYLDNGLQKLIDTRTAELEVEKATADEKRRIDEENAAREQAVNKARFQMAYDTLNLISNITELFGRRNEKQARIAFGIDKAAKLASATIAGIEGTIEAYKTAQKSPITAVFPAYPIVQAGLAGAFAATNIAKIAQTQFNANGSSVNSTTPSGGQSYTPQFNVVGSSGVNQLAQVQQQPVKAYITSGDVVSAMSLERNKLQKTSI